MIIKGSSRGQSAADALALAMHLLAKENEAVELLEVRGVVATELPAALEEMRTITLGTRARRGLYHASMSLDRDEAPTMGRTRWHQAVDELERRLGMSGHQRAVIRHVKRGREHVHVVWCRVQPVTMKLARDSQNYRRHEECSRALETKWNLNPVVGVHTRPPGTSRPVALGTHGDWQAQERTGIAIRDVASALQEAWAASPTGQAFAAAIRREGFRLARGRRGIVSVDEAWTPHSLPRRLQLKAAVVQRRLADIDMAMLPTVEDFKARITTSRRNTMDTGNTKIMEFGATDARPRRGRRPADRSLLLPGYWQAMGLEFDEVADAIRVKLPGGTVLWDRGDRLTLSRVGEPTDEEIRILVAAGKSRGWEEIRFSGGTPEFQRRARVEALRQGYRLDQIFLECEDGMPQPMSVAPMPDHVRRRFAPPRPAVPADPPIPDAPASWVRP